MPTRVLSKSAELGDRITPPCGGGGSGVGPGSVMTALVTLPPHPHSHRVRTNMAVNRKLWEARPKRRRAGDLWLDGTAHLRLTRQKQLRSLNMVRESTPNEPSAQCLRSIRSPITSARALVARLRRPSQQGTGSSVSFWEHKPAEDSGKHWLIGGALIALVLSGEWQNIRNQPRRVFPLDDFRSELALRRKQKVSCHRFRCSHLMGIMAGGRRSAFSDWPDSPDEPSVLPLLERVYITNSDRLEIPNLSKMLNR